MTREVHVERLLGRRVHDVDGRSIGRIEEMLVELHDGEHVVTEFHLATGGLIERILGFVRRLPPLAWLTTHRARVCVRWSDLDLSDPSRPRARVRRDALTARGGGAAD